MCDDLHKLSATVRNVRRKDLVCPTGTQPLDSNPLVCIPSEGMKEVGVSKVADDFRCYLQCSTSNGQDVSDMCQEMGGDPFCRFEKKVDCGCMNTRIGVIGDDSNWGGYYTYDIPKFEESNPSQAT